MLLGVTDTPAQEAGPKRSEFGMTDQNYGLLACRKVIRYTRSTDAHTTNNTRKTTVTLLSTQPSIVAP